MRRRRPDGDGQYDVYLFDLNGDGRPENNGEDTTAIDEYAQNVNGDGEPDKVWEAD